MRKSVKPGEIFAILLAFISIAPFCYVLIGSYFCFTLLLCVGAQLSACWRRHHI